MLLDHSNQNLRLRAEGRHTTAYIMGAQARQFASRSDNRLSIVRPKTLKIILFGAIERTGVIT